MGVYAIGVYVSTGIKTSFKNKFRQDLPGLRDPAGLKSGSYFYTATNWFSPQSGSVITSTIKSVIETMPTNFWSSITGAWPML